MSGKAIPWELFPYQKEAIQSTLDAIDLGFKAPLNVMPTGTGKTQTYIGLAQRFLDEDRGGRVMILAHRKDLVDAPVMRIKNYFPSMSKDVGKVMADWRQPGSKIIVASRDTIGRGDMLALQQILKYGKIGLVITDECHEFGYGQSKKDEQKIAYRIRQYMRESNPNMIEAGFTATPREAQGHIWDTISTEIKLTWAIRNGYLAEPLWFPVQVGVKLSELPRSGTGDMRDFSKGNLADVLETQNWCDLIVRTHIEKADRSGPSLAFTVSVAGSKLLADTFNAAGVKAMHIDGEFNPEQRKKVMDAILSGDVEVVCNCAIWTIGVDIPPVRNLHVARPTMSNILYMQMIGRGLRTFPGKMACNIFEYSDFDGIELAWIGKALDLPARRDIVVQKKEDGSLTGLAFTASDGVKYLSGDPAELVTLQVDRLNRSKWDWIGGGRNDWMFLPIGRWGEDLHERTYLVPPPSITNTALYAHVKKPDRTWFIAQVDGTSGMDYDKLLEIAEGRAERYGDPALAMRNREWRTRPVSEDQIKAFPAVVTPSMTQGQASRAITDKLMRDALRKKGFFVT